MATETELAAGRELDSLVATALGWTHIAPHTHCGYGPDYQGEREEPVWPARIGALPVPKYSTDIAAAWQVVEYLKNKSLMTTVAVSEQGRAGDGNYQWWCQIKPALPHTSHIDGPFCDTAPEAICRAALIATDIHL